MMTVNVFFAVIYLWLAITSLAKGQYFPGGLRNNFNPQSQPPGNPSAQSFRPQNFAPGPQHPDFNRNPQNVRQAPNFNPFPPPTFPSIPDHSSSFPPQMNRPTSFTPPSPVPYNPTYIPQRPSSSIPNPHQSPFNHGAQGPGPIFSNSQQTNPFNPGAQGPGSIFNIPQQTNPFNHGVQDPGSMFNSPQQSNPFNRGTQSSGPIFNIPQQTNPFNRGAQSPGSIINNPQQASPFNRGVQRTGPIFNNPQQGSPFNRGAQSPSPIFNKPQQTTPFYRGVLGPSNIFTNPHPTDSFITPPQQASPLNHPPISLLPSPTEIINPSTLKLIEEAIISPIISPQQSSLSYISPKEIVPTSPDSQQNKPLSPQPTPQQLDQDSTSSQQSNLDSTIPQQTTSDSAVPQRIVTDSAAPQKPELDSTVPQQPASDSTIPEKSASDSTVSQKPDSQPAVPQPADSMSTVSQQPASDATIIQQPASDSIVPQQPDSKPTVLQKTDSEPTSPQKTITASDDVQPITSTSEASSSVSNTPQNPASASTMPQQPVPISHNRNSTTQYIPRSEKQTDFSTFRDPLRGLRIVCLFNNKHFYRNGFTPAKLEPHLCTHLNYEFAVLDPKTYEMIVGEPDLDIDMNFYEEAIGLKHVYPKLKVLVSLGGWSDSTKKYSILASDPAKRANFVDKAIQFLLNHEFDGLDLAWEYPNCWQGAIGINPKDKANFVALLKDIKQGFKDHGLILSISVGAIKREVEAAYDVPAISKIVDYINVMTYDMHGPWESKTGIHVQFEGKPGDKDPYCNVKGGMQVWIEKGAPKRKLNMGLALYGRTYTLQNPKQCGMGVPAVGPGNPGPVTKEGGIMNYHEICKFLNSGKWVEKEDTQAGFYACSDDGQWAGYDPPVMMVRKVKYVVNSGLGGVLLKDLSGDDSDGDCFNMPFPCLKMVKMEMVHKAKRKYP